MPETIVRVTVVPVRVPLSTAHQRLRTGRTHIERTVVEIETSSGIVGVGETRGLWPTPIIRDRFGPRITGQPALDRQAARQRCLDRQFDFGFPERMVDQAAYAAVDLALWDIAGKHDSVPVCDLLGGRVRPHALFGAYGYPPEPDLLPSLSAVPRLVAHQAEAAVAATGADLFEYKVGRLPLATDVASVLAIREAVGERVAIALDPNMAYDLDAAASFLAGVVPAHPANIEEPVRSLAAMDRLAARFDVAMSTHALELDLVAAFPHITGIVPDIGILGGLEATVAFIESVVALGRKSWLRSVWELGISFAAMCHLGIAVRELDRPSQCMIQFAADDLIEGEPWFPHNGGVSPPASPGLGVTLDRAALHRYRVDGGAV
jgi:L-alanine-DL-glutamate epimerase-like enolase superfamily enzyme